MHMQGSVSARGRRLAKFLLLFLSLTTTLSALLRLIVSSTQIIPNQKGMDEWGVFPHERQCLFELLKLTVARAVLLVSGNVHFSEVSKIDNGGYPLYEFTASGMTYVDSTYAAAPNNHRVAGPFIDHNFGLIQIDWESQPGPVVRMRALGIKGQTGFEQAILLSEGQ